MWSFKATFLVRVYEMLTQSVFRVYQIACKPQTAHLPRRTQQVYWPLNVHPPLSPPSHSPLYYTVYKCTVTTSATICHVHNDTQCSEGYGQSGGHFTFRVASPFLVTQYTILSTHSYVSEHSLNISGFHL